MYYCFIPQPSHLASTPFQSTSLHHDHDHVTSIQTFREIMEHGSKLSDTPKHQESDTAPDPQQHSYDETVS